MKKYYFLKIKCKSVESVESVAKKKTISAVNSNYF